MGSGNGVPSADTVRMPDGNHQPAEAHTTGHAASGKPSSGTGITLVISAILIAALLGGAFFLVHRSRARTEADLSAQTAANASAASAVDVVHVQYASPIHTLSPSCSVRLTPSSTGCVLRRQR